MRAQRRSPAHRSEARCLRKFGSVGLLLYVRQAELFSCKVFVHDAAYFQYGLRAFLNAVA